MADRKVPVAPKLVYKEDAAGRLNLPADFRKS